MMMLSRAAARMGHDARIEVVSPRSCHFFYFEYCLTSIQLSSSGFRIIRKRASNENTKELLRWRCQQHRQQRPLNRLFYESEHRFCLETPYNPIMTGWLLLGARVSACVCDERACLPACLPAHSAWGVSSNNNSKRK